jgi:hypothetical protein
MMARDYASHQRTAASIVTILVVVLATGVARGGPSAQERAKDQALQEFDQRLVEYVSLRRSVSEKMMPIAPTASGRELAARQMELAGALKSARAAAKPGDLIPPSIAAMIRLIVLDDFRRRSATDGAAAFSEVPNAPRPAINTPYPASAALPTLPPLLLSRLPRLPEHLQYRFYGRHLVVLDGDTAIIVDYLADVLPRR